MKLHRLICVAILASAALTAIAQDAQTVKVSAKGDDVRAVVHDLFQQVKKNYILDPEVKAQIFMALNDVEFDEAFELICKTAGLTYEVQNGIYFIKSTAAKPKQDPPAKSEPPKTEPAKTTKSETAKSVPTRDTLPPVPPLGDLTTVPPANSAGKPIGQKSQILDKSVLAKRITTRLEKVEIRALAAELTKQTGVQIEVDSAVPAYRLDAFLLKTSLKYALDRITKAARLNYTFTDRNSILIQNGTASQRS